MPDNVLFLDDYVKSVLDIINFYKMTDIVLIGHSFGGRVAIKIAGKYGYLLRKLILVDSAGVLPRRTIKYRCRILRHKILSLLKIEHSAGSSDYQKLDNNGKQTFKNIVNEDLSGLAAKITVPTLLFWGSKDKETAIYMAKRLKKLIYNSCLVIFKGAGHYSYLDAPNMFYKLVLIFLSEGGYGMVISDSFDNFKLGGVTKVICDKSAK